MFIQIQKEYINTNLIRRVGPIEVETRGHVKLFFDIHFGCNDVHTVSVNSDCFVSLSPHTRNCSLLEYFSTFEKAEKSKKYQIALLEMQNLHSNLITQLTK